MKETGIYVHIPFCDHKCIYCDFYSIITTDNIASYKAALVKEINHYSVLHSEDISITSIYFGGGTPSLMEPVYLKDIIDHIKKNFNVPGWIYMTSDYVARRIIRLAKRPRRALVIPWWFRPLITIDTLFPGLVDWFLKVTFVQRFHKLTKEDLP